MESAAYSVLRLDGLALGGGELVAAEIEDLIDSFDEPLVVVVPAFKGAASALKGAADDRADAEAALALLGAGHLAIAEAMDAPGAALEAASLRIELILRRLSALFAGEGPFDRAEVLASGARLSATCVALAFAALGRPAPILEPPRRELRDALSRFPASVVPELRGLGASIVAEEFRAELFSARAEASSSFRSAGPGLAIFAPAAGLRSPVALNPGVA